MRKPLSCMKNMDVGQPKIHVILPNASNDRNDEKVMIFVAIMDGKIPIIHEFIDDDGRRVSVDGSCYLALLQDKVWPTFRATATRRRRLVPGCNDLKPFRPSPFRPNFR